MAERNYFIPLWKGVMTPEHIAAIGPAFPLFIWMIDHTTNEDRGEDGQVWGSVLRGKEVPIDLIAKDLGYVGRTVQRHLDQLIEGGYIRSERGARGCKYQVAKSKKYPNGDRTKVSHLASKQADRTKVSHEIGQNCPPDRTKTPSDRTEVSDPIGQNCHIASTHEHTWNIHEQTENKTRAPARGDLTRINALLPDGPKPKASGTPAAPPEDPAEAERQRREAERLAREAAGLRRTGPPPAVEHCTEAERAARARGRALLPAFIKQRERE